MNRVVILVVLAGILKPSVQRSTTLSDSYVAAVMEYQPAFTTAANLQNYLEHIRSAAEQDADVIVFPELTLNVGDPVEVPIRDLLNTYPIPALRPDLYHEVLVSISSAARQHGIYVVINVEERMNCTSSNHLEDFCPEPKEYLFNTNVVFDRNGNVIDRYRKINLFGERSRTPALKPDLGYFSTDFGVTFGHFICFDLMFQVPATQVVEKMKVTDIIFTTMWFSEMPYLTAVQIQEAFAFSLNVNFIAAGTNNVRVGSAGSGIYSGKAGALTSTMPGLTTTRMLVARVPKVPGQVTAPVPGPIYDPPTDHDSLVLITDPSLPSHVTRELVPGLQEFQLVDREVTCAFRVDMAEGQPESGGVSYKYRAGVFSGVRSFSGVATGGVRICSIFACTGDSISTCGKRYTQFKKGTTAVFKELIITASVPTPVVEPAVEAKDSAYFPLSLDVSIMPLELEYYTYSEDTKANITVYSLSLNKNDVELYSFAIWGRYYETDGQDADPPLAEDLEPIDPENPEIDGDTDSSKPDSSVVHLVNSLFLIPALALMFR